MNKPVLITGYSAATSVGENIDATWESIKYGRSGIAPITQWDITGWQYPLAAEINYYNPREMVSDRKLLKLLSRHDVVGLYAVDQAIAQSGLATYRDQLSNPTKYNDRTGLFVASAGIKFNQQYDLLPLFAHAKGDMQQFADKLFEMVHPMWLLRILSNNVIAYAGIKYNFKGPNQNIVNHGVSGVQAIAEAYHAIQSGAVDRAVVVGYEATEPQALIYYAGVGLISPTGLRAFDAAHNGTVLAEGAGVLVLETEASAKERNATIYGEILASQTSSETTGVFSISEDGIGLQQAISVTLQKASMKPDEVAFVCAHGNGTVQSDISESKAISHIFGENNIPVTGFKWSLGHTVAAAGIIETALSLIALREKTAPGIANLENLADECQAIQVSNDNQSITKNSALVITRGFSGLNACLLVKAH
jgi:3-oxoacyl-[acyl-carrier-protein] synthase-1